MQPTQEQQPRHSIKGDINGGLKVLSSAFKTNKNDFIKIGVGTLAAKLVLGSTGRYLKY